MFRSEKRAFRAIERLEDDLKAVRTQVTDLASANKRLELEWVETYDKVRHQLSRMARRGDLSNGKDPEPIVPEDANAEPEVDPISAKIHARRSRGFLGRTQ